jgi:hypothetical protein
MKLLILKLAAVLILVIPGSAFAIEYLWTDQQGVRHFDCGGFIVGGEAAIKELGRGLYRAKGILINRQVRATSIYHAARIACGEADEMPEPKPAGEAEKEE